MGWCIDTGALAIPEANGVEPTRVYLHLELSRILTGLFADRFVSLQQLLFGELLSKEHRGVGGRLLQERSFHLPERPIPHLRQSQHEGFSSTIVQRGCVKGTETSL